MDQQTMGTMRKTFKYKLLPEQEHKMAFVLRRCRELYNAALQERRDAWQKCHMSITCAQQSSELPAIKEVRPEYTMSTPRSCRMCSPAWIVPFKPFFAGWRRVSSRAIHAFRAGIASRVSPTSSSVTG